MYGVFFNFIKGLDIEEEASMINNTASNYCVESMGNYYNPIFITKFSDNTYYYSCGTKDKLIFYDLTSEELYCLQKKIYISKNEKCEKINEKLESIFQEVTTLQEKEEKYKSFPFVLELANKLAQDIQDLEKKTILNDLSSKIDRELRAQLNLMSDPLYSEMSKLIVNQNIEICKRYKFKEGSEIFNRCLLVLIDNSNQINFENGLIPIGDIIKHHSGLVQVGDMINLYSINK